MFILQSFQQLCSTYGKDIDKIIYANSAHTIFMTSTNEEIIDELARRTVR